MVLKFELNLATSFQDSHFFRKSFTKKINIAKANLIEIMRVQ